MRLVLAITLVAFFVGVSSFGEGPQAPLDDLIATVNGKDSIKSAKAIAAIADRKLASDSAIETLIDALSDDRRATYIPDHVPITFPVETVASTASDALAEIGEPAVHPICTFLSKSRDKNARRLAVRSLSMMKGAAAESLPTLRRLLNDSEMEIRLEAVKAVVAVQKNSIALSSTLGTVLSDESPDVRAAAARALGNLGEEGSSQVSHLVKLLDDTGHRWHFYTPDIAATRPVRYDTAMALAEMGADARVALPRLRKLMAEGPDKLVGVAAAYAIAKLDDDAENALKYLAQSVRDRENGTQVPEAAAEALGQIGPRAKGTLPALIDALEHPATMVRIRAVEAIAAIAPESAEARLLPMLRDEHGLVRASAIESLSMLPTASPQLLDALIAALDDSERIFGRNVRSAAAVALGKFAKDGSPALSRLKQLVKQEENERVRKAAEDAVRQITQGG